MAVSIIGVKHLVVVQNKIELVPKERVLENYEQIKQFLETTPYADAPVIPVSAIHRANLEVLVEAIERQIPTPHHDLSKPARMYVARSFDVNRPGAKPEALRGGVIGGSVLQGRFRVGDEVEVKPGIKLEREGRSFWHPLRSEVVSLQAGGESIEEAKPGGLVGIGTKLDPSLAKGDALAGAVAGAPETLPEVLESLSLQVHLLERVVGLAKEVEVAPLTTGEPLMLNVGTATTAGVITSARGEVAEVKLKLPVCANPGARAAISRRIGGRWRLIGYGIIS